MYFDASPTGANLIILWEELRVVVPIGIAT
jgi:hypothetical protein